MSGVAGYKAQLKLGGVPTIFTDENLTHLGNGIFRISDSLKRVISADYPLELTDDSDSAIINFPVNYLDGVLYVDDWASWDLPLKLTGRYIPLLYIGGSKEYKLDIGGDILDDSAFHSQTDLSEGYREKKYGIFDVSASIGRWNDFSNKLLDAKIAKTPVFVSINPGASNTFIKGWFHIETDSLSGDIGGLEEEAVSLVLSGNNSQTYFSYSYNYTDLEAQALTEQELLDNYFPLN